MKTSASGLRRFENCPGSFGLRYLEEKTEEDNYPAQVGKLTHAMIRERLTKGKVDLPIGEKTGKAMMEAADLYQRWEKIFLPDLDASDVLTTEEKLSIKFGEHEIEFILDDLREIGGIPTVTDWKTTQKFRTKDELEKDIQARLYLVAVAKLYPSYQEFIFREGNIRHGIYSPLEVSREEIEVYAESLKMMIDNARAHMEAKKAGDKDALPFTPSGFCLHCGFFKECPAAKKAYKEAGKISNVTGALGACSRIALLTRELKNWKTELKSWVSAKGSVTSNGVTWAFRVSTWLNVDLGSVNDDDLLNELKPYLVPDDGKKSKIWENTSLIAKLKKAGALVEKSKRDFKGAVSEDEETLEDE